nr:hypothetical protein [Anaerolineae bacterium]
MMVNQTGDSDKVLCGVCGKPNPANAVVCEHCGSRLGLERDGELFGGPLDPLDALRSEAGGVESSKSPTGRLTEPEPDFVFGDHEGRPTPIRAEQTSPPRDPSLASSSTGIPGWIRHSGPPSPGEEGEPPSWLKHAGPVVSEPPGEIPDWLSHVALPSTPSSGPITTPALPHEEPSFEEALDWLSGGPGSVEELPAAESPAWLLEDMPDEDLAIESTEGLPESLEPLLSPEWLDNADEELSLDIFGDLEEEPSGEDFAPDWLLEPEPLAEEKPLTRPEEPELVPEITPDWLVEMAGEAPGTELPDISGEEGETDEEPLPEPPDVLPAEPAPAHEPSEIELAEELPEQGLAESEPIGLEEPLLEETIDWMDELDSLDTGEGYRAEEDVPPSDPLRAFEIEAEPESGQLLELSLDEQTEQAAPPSLAEEVLEEPGPLEEGLPIEEPEPEPVEEAVEVEEGVPDWLKEIDLVGEEEREEGATAEMATESSQPVSPLIKSGMPDWLLSGEEAEDQEARQEIEQAEAEKPSDWLDILAPGEEEALGMPPIADTGEEPLIPDWMKELTDEEEPFPDLDFPELETPMAAADEKAPADNMDWAAALDWVMAEAPAAPAVAGEDLLGLSGDLFSLGEEEPITAEEPAPEEMPEWFHKLQEQEEESVSVEGPPSPVDQIDSLRYSAILGAKPEEGEPALETYGALKDVADVIQPELIFEGSSLVVAEPRDELLLTETHAEQILLVEKYLHADRAEAPLTRAGRRVPVLRWVVALLILAALLISAVMDYRPFSSASAPSAATAAYDALEELAGDTTTVLVAFEFEPDTAAEMNQIARAILEHLATRDSVTVYTISTRTTGSAVADDILRDDSIYSRLKENSGTWLNLGYLPGKANGVSGLTIGTPTSAVSPLAHDYLGAETGIEEDRLVDGEIDAIVILTNRYDDLKMWVEQAGTPSGLPVIAGVSATLAPLAAPYWDSKQLIGLVSGVNDAVAYQQLSTGRVSPVTLTTFNTQALVSTLAALIIIIGAVWNGISSRRNRQERRK